MNSVFGAFGEVHNLYIHNVSKGDPVKTLKVGNLVDFRAIRPIANAIRKGN
jgi:hypothetical protein